MSPRLEEEMQGTKLFIKVVLIRSLIIVSFSLFFSISVISSYI